MISRFFRWLGADLKEIGLSFAEGDWKTKLSFLIMGFGQLCRGQIVRGLTMLALEGGILYYVLSFGWSFLSNIFTLGTVETHKEGRKTVYGDNSFLILLYGLLTVVIILALHLGLLLPAVVPCVSGLYLYQRPECPGCACRVCAQQHRYGCSHQWRPGCLACGNNLRPVTLWHRRVQSRAV